MLGKNVHTTNLWWYSKNKSSQPCSWIRWPSFLCSHPPCSSSVQQKFFPQLSLPVIWTSLNLDSTSYRLQIVTNGYNHGQTVKKKKMQFWQIELVRLLSHHPALTSDAHRSELCQQYITKFTVREMMPVMNPVLITSGKWVPWKRNMRVEGGFNPSCRCPICPNITNSHIY